MREKSTAAMENLFAEAVRSTGPNEWMIAAKALGLGLAECQRALSADGWGARDVGTFANVWARKVGSG